MELPPRPPATHEKSRHDGAVHRVEQMSLHAHPAAMQGGKKNKKKRVGERLPKRTHTHTLTRLRSKTNIHPRAVA